MSLIRVCSIPYASGSNPYLELLHAGLSSKGVQFLIPSSSVDDIMTHASDGMIIHFHWPSRLYSHSERDKMEQRVQKFVLLLNHIVSQGAHIVWTVHNLMPHEVLHLDLEVIARAALVKNCSAVITHCQRAAEEVAARFGDNIAIHVINHPDLSAAYPTPIPKNVSKSTLGYQNNPFIFLFFGLLRPYKGLDLVINTFNKLPSQNARLIVAGKPSESFNIGRLESAAAQDPRIRLYLSSISKECVAKLYGAADISLHCYTSILTSGSVVLAMGMSTAVVAPRIGCLEEIISQETGVLYEQNEPRSLEHVLNRVMNMNVEEMGVAGKQRVSLWSPQLIADQLLTVYLSVLGLGYP